MRSATTKKTIAVSLALSGVAGLFFWLKGGDGLVTITESKKNMNMETEVSEPISPKASSALKNTAEHIDKAPARTLEPVSSLSHSGDEQKGKSSTKEEVEPAVVEYLKTQNYSAMSPVEINELLNLLTLGEGKDFLENKKNHIVNLDDFTKLHPKNGNVLDRLHGRYHSDFVNSVPTSDDEGYTVELLFDRNRLTVSFIQKNQLYYQYVFQNPRKQLMTAKSSHIPPNLFVELPANPRIGYIHPIYLEIMIGSDLRSLIAVLYNSNQFVQNTNYVHAENLIFSKID